MPGQFINSGNGGRISLANNSNTGNLSFSVAGSGPSPSFTAIIDTSFGGNGFAVGLPYDSTGTYTGTIDWGDGTITSNSFANRSHTYATSNQYTITIDGQISGFNFYYYFSFNNTLSIVLKSITDFGNQFSFGPNLDNAFYNCSQLTSVASNIPLAGDITGMFGNLSLFNADVSGWDVSSVTNMSGLFSNCTSFNSNLSAWDVSGLFAAPGMLTGCTSFSSTNLNALYNGWASLPTLQTGVPFGAPSTCYTSASAASRAILTGTYSWEITDNGLCS
jgi:surface protein